MPQTMDRDTIQPYCCFCIPRPIYPINNNRSISKQNNNNNTNSCDCCCICTECSDCPDCTDCDGCDD